MKWNIAKLGQVTERIRNGLNISQASDAGGLPITRIETISNQVIDPGKFGFAGIQEGDKADWYLKSGEILFSHINSEERIGNSALYEGIPYPLVHGMNLLSLTPDETKILPKFLLYFARSMQFHQSLKPIIKRAVNQASVSIGNLRTIDIPLPLLSEQRRIVEILDQADALRKKRAEADAKAARILPTLFYKMFGDPATNPKGWPTVRIQDLVTSIERRDPTLQPDNIFIYIDIAGVDGKTGIIVEMKELLGAAAPSRARQVIRENDVIVSTVRPYLRATALVPKHLDNEICSTGFCVLRARKGRGFGFLYALSRLQWFTDQINARARGASYPAVTDGDILNLAIPCPDQTKTHEAFNAQVLGMLSLQKRRDTSAKAIQNLFASLLHRTFTGDLTAKWREAHIKELLAEIEQQSKYLNQDQMV